MEVASQTPESAKQFLLTRVLEEAQRDGVKLTDIERRMFLFSETSGQADPEANEKFESEYDSDKYERKITALLKNAYQRDAKNTVEQQSWKEALAALRNEDFYGLVMIDAAGIPRPQATAAIPSLFDKRLIIFLITAAGVIGIAVLLILDPLRSNFIRPGWPRIVLIPVFLGILWWLAEMHRRSVIGGPPSR